ncbi:hypothetical protein Leryth_011216 [Lithospermum erythrorhizon]|nr:hypothetical protein Leryth_011216 [Lithospermum erythrorhizon]
MVSTKIPQQIKQFGDLKVKAFFLDGINLHYQNHMICLQIFQKQYSHYIDNVGASSDGNDEKKEFLFSSSNLLKHDHTNFKICNEEQPSVPKDGTGVDNPKLSSENIVRLAGERFIDFASHMFINTNTNVCPYSSNLTRLTEDDKMDVELVQLLFTVVEEVSHKKTDRACRLLSDCRKIASNRRRPVQKAELYFAEALAKKIERETGKIVSNIWEAENPIGPAISPKLNNLNAILACYQRLPFHLLFFSTIDRKVKFLF